MDGLHQIDELAETMAGLLDEYVQWGRRQGWSANEFFVLYSVARHGQCPPKTIAEEWCLPKQTVSFTCRQLAEKGWLAVAADPGDKRGKLLSLTAEGSAAVRPLLDELERGERIAAAQFGMKKLEKLVQELKRLQGLLSANLTAADGGKE